MRNNLLSLTLGLITKAISPVLALLHSVKWHGKMFMNGNMPESIKDHCVGLFEYSCYPSMCEEKRGIINAELRHDSQ